MPLEACGRFQPGCAAGVDAPRFGRRQDKCNLILQPLAEAGASRQRVGEADILGPRRVVRLVRREELAVDQLPDTALGRRLRIYELGPPGEIAIAEDRKSVV